MRTYIFLIGGIVLGSEIVWQSYKMLRRLQERRCADKRNSSIDRQASNKSKERIVEVMFFSSESSLCRSHGNDGGACSKKSCPARHLSKLIDYIDRAKKSLDVCMYVLTCQALSRAIVNAHSRGIVVRVITDHGMAYNDAAQTTLFRKRGVAVRAQRLDSLMHHKFVIVDREILITGSTNWTMTAFFGNFENILVTNESSLVEPFVEEFERLWTNFGDTTQLLPAKNLSSSTHELLDDESRNGKNGTRLTEKEEIGRV